ncbi:MAG TPA: hypothetical protein VFH58_17590 [Acidimicrobiales bacterium]|nr:hypothetical protein [Acidimicrobiales bacterium]
MAGERFVVLGLAPARSAWFEAVAQWTTSAAIAAEFVKCVSAEEVRARLASGRRHSALLVDSSSPSFDRDLVDACAGQATPVIVVHGRRSLAGTAADLGVAAELPARFAPEDLLDALSAHCRPVSDGAVLPPAMEDPETAFWQAPLFAVCGPGGTGASTVAIALASGLCRDPRFGGRVLLADLARRADQAMLHDSPELGPGVQELVDAHRLSRPRPEEIIDLTFQVPRRGYSLLLGLRQPEGWAGLRPRSFDAAITGLRRSFQVVVADLSGDFEGEADGGSIDVQERNHMSRATALQATVVLAVGAPGLKGVHSLARLMAQMTRAGVAAERVVPVVNRSPRHPRARAESARALAGLLESYGLSPALAAPVHVPERKLEELLRDGSPLPGALVDPVTRSARAVADRLADAAPPDTGPTRIDPGTLGTWAEDDPEVEA